MTRGRRGPSSPCRLLSSELWGYTQLPLCHCSCRSRTASRGPAPHAQPGGSASPSPASPQRCSVPGRLSGHRAVEIIRRPESQPVSSVHVTLPEVSPTLAVPGVSFHKQHFVFLPFQGTFHVRCRRTASWVDICGLWGAGFEGNPSIESPGAESRTRCPSFCFSCDVPMALSPHLSSETSSRTRLPGAPGNPPGVEGPGTWQHTWHHGRLRQGDRLAPAT